MNFEWKTNSKHQINKENILIVGLLILGSCVVVVSSSFLRKGKEIYCIFSRRRRNKYNKMRNREKRLSN